MRAYRNTAVAAAIEAGQAILKIYHSGNFDVTVKGDDSPLTRADVASHDVIMRHLIPTGIPVLSEEGRDIPFEERSGWRELWVVDPIDGTKEFIKRNGEFTVNIALVRDGVPVLGVIYVPVTGELYVGTEGEGAVKTMHPAGDDAAAEAVMEGADSIPVDTGDRPYTAVASRSHMSPETDGFIAELRKEHGEVALISKGSSLKLCMVAEGKADCYPRFAPTMEWDTAAGQAICMAAGFDVIDQNTGETMRYNREDLLNAWFLVK
ncbi:MAG TPA: 3'(2'),5'-bisphosphate nucleotidase [Flavobacteriales bacterium]|jgi:3'(2'), 5'-bisphosphate nucleotidase|nr:3'(2'),5'-bisphosphate nucleotidase [Flavobacteriales bacterium]